MLPTRAGVDAHEEGRIPLEGHWHWHIEHPFEVAESKALIDRRKCHAAHLTDDEVRAIGHDRLEAAVLVAVLPARDQMLQMQTLKPLPIRVSVLTAYAHASVCAYTRTHTHTHLFVVNALLTR